MPPTWNQLQAVAREEIGETLGHLPEALRRRAAALPLSLERFPSPALEADGVHPDTLGLFVGESFPEGDGATTAGLPPQVVLFLENLWLESAGNDRIYREEVRTTYLHELGHYLGLSEEELDDRDLL